MSSAVNKSSKRFVPKVGARGSSIRAPVRRNTRTSFSAPDSLDTAPAAQTPRDTPSKASDSQAAAELEPLSKGAQSRAEALGLSTSDIASGAGSAIDDTVEEAPQDSPAQRHASHGRLSSTHSRRISRASSIAAPKGVSAVPEVAAGTSGVTEVSTQDTLVQDHDAAEKKSRARSVQFDLEPQQIISEADSEGSFDQTQTTQTSTAHSQPATDTLKRIPGPPDAPSADTTSQLPVKPAELKQVPQKSSARAHNPPAQSSLHQPVRLSGLNNGPRRAPPPSMKRPLTRPGSASTSTTRTSSVSEPLRTIRVVPRPEAPPGCQIIEPEDIQELKREERRRREAWENAQMKLMRELFVEKERKRLVDEESYDEASSTQVAQATSEAMTFNALKQAVMSELKEYKEKMEKAKDAQSKEKGTSQTDTAVVAASAAADTAASILDSGPAPPLKQLINVEKFRMSDLCKDIPVGTPNEKYDDYENARVQRRRDRLLLLRAKNWKRNALKREPSESEKALLETVYAKFKNERLARSDKIKEESEQKLKNLDDSARGGAVAAPTLEIGQDGQIRIEHTQVDRHLHNRSNQNESGQNKIEVDETQKTINSYSFSTKERPERWSKEETQKFYEALSAWGTDFNLIAHLFPTRTRHQIKTKFKYEERRHSVKVQMYLVHRRKANVNSYAEVSDQQIEDVKDIEEALERVRDEHEERMKIEQTAREQARSEDNEKQEQRDSPKRRAREASAPAPKRERVR